MTLPPYAQTAIGRALIAEVKPRSVKPLAERFWAKVDKRGPDECWPWTGSCSRNGYGRIGRGRADEGADGAHRVSWELANGRPVPQGLFVRHSCDNPICVNPAHLGIGTPADNTRDSIVRGRAAFLKLLERTHCRHGHELTEENTLRQPSKRGRRCRACVIARGRKARRMRKEIAA